MTCICTWLLVSTAVVPDLRVEQQQPAKYYVLSYVVALKAYNTMPLPE